jgi:hypothetical protein
MFCIGGALAEVVHWLEVVRARRRVERELAHCPALLSVEQWLATVTVHTAAPVKVMVVGVSGSGKSTLAAQLSSVVDAPYINMDRLFWGVVAPKYVGGGDGDGAAAIIGGGGDGDGAAGQWASFGSFRTMLMGVMKGTKDNTGNYRYVCDGSYSV